MTNKNKKHRKKHAVAAISELPPGARMIANIGGRSVGIFNINGQVKAVLNICPHELAPLCRGRVDGTTLPSPPGQYHWGREGEILFCPWHGWEFDLVSGGCLTDKRKRLHFFPVTIEAGKVFVSV